MLHAAPTDAHRFLLLLLLLLLCQHRLLRCLLFLLIHRVDGLGAQRAAGWFIGQDLGHQTELIAVIVLSGG
ncbi:hypothetical protein NX04_18545, partial [Xanthomonas vasicola]